MDKVRLGIIGMGNIGKYHADLSKKKVSRCELAAVAEEMSNRRNRRSATTGCVNPSKQFLELRKNSAHAFA